MPVAVSTGSYEVTASLDLSPVFGKISRTETLEIERPGDDWIEKRLEQLGSEDVGVRRQAIIDLRYFPGHADRVVPALVKILDDPDASLRMLVLSVLGAYPTEAAKHVDRYLAILSRPDDGTDSMVRYERANAAYLLGRVSPEDDRVLAALEAAVKSEDANLKQRAEYALKMYRQRHPGKPPEEPESK